MSQHNPSPQQYCSRVHKFDLHMDADAAPTSNRTNASTIGNLNAAVMATAAAAAAATMASIGGGGGGGGHVCTVTVAVSIVVIIVVLIDGTRTRVGDMWCSSMGTTADGRG